MNRSPSSQAIPEPGTEPDSLVERLIGRADYLHHEVKTPELMREAADRLILYREALEEEVAAREAWLETDDGSNAEVHALARMQRADDRARAALSRSVSSKP